MADTYGLGMVIALTFLGLILVSLASWYDRNWGDPT